MGIIQQMSPALANKIAAGEVVERPASVVKELVENSIDAGATDITVELLEAGIQQVKVTDNGKGMSPDDLHLSIEPHASSKIYRPQDLFRINSLGFRGEALASISSISKLKIESGQKEATDESAGTYYIDVEDSKIIDHGPASNLYGTRVTVDSIFYNTPARLKHLKSLRTELRHILTAIQDIALAHPGIRLRLLNDGQEVFQSYGRKDLRQTIANVYQPTIARDLLPIQGADNDFKITGYVSPPRLTRTNRYYMHWIVNGRAVRSYVLNRALLDAYDKQLMIGRFPISVINIELDPRLVDVNVHPTKQTVRISKEDHLVDLIRQAVGETLGLHNPVPQAKAPRQTQTATIQEEIPLTYQPPQPSQAPIDTRESTLPKDSSPQFSQIFGSDDSSMEAVNEFTVAETVEELPPLSSHEVDPVIHEKKVDFSLIRYLGQIHGTYLIAEYPGGFYLIDQHAAQERINYEKLLKGTADTYHQQSLLVPVIIQLSPSDTQSFYLVKERLEGLGLFLSEFGPQSFQMDSYPAWIEVDKLEETVNDLIQMLLTQPSLTVAQIKEDAIIMEACRSSIKANEYLDKDQAYALIMSLEPLDDPFHCPHGRPVFIDFDQQSIEKMFQRIPN